MPRLSIVILNFNTKELTLRAVQSCHNLASKNIEVVVVDNASSDGSVEALAKYKPIALKENLGFAGGNNVALKHVTSEYVMLLNSDAYFPKGEDIESVLAYMDKYGDIGVLSPFVELGNSKIDPACHRGFPSPWNAWSYFLKFEKITRGIPVLQRIFGGYHQTWKSLDRVHDIDACTGAAMIVRTSAMKEVGLLDEQFFMYGEDLDWCYRFKQKGWRVVFYPLLKVIHDKHSSGFKKGHSKTKDAFYDAMKLFYKKHDLGPAWMENLVLIGIHVLSKRR